MNGKTTDQGSQDMTRQDAIDALDEKLNLIMDKLGIPLSEDKENPDGDNLDTNYDHKGAKIIKSITQGA